MLKKKHPGKRRRRAPDPAVRVTPSPAIEARVSEEVARAVRVADALTPANLLDSGYLASAIYYHDGLFDGFNENRPDADPADRIVAHIAHALAPNTKRAYIDLLLDACAGAFSELAAGPLVVPVPFDEPLPVGRGAHPFAIDLFVPDLTAVRSASRGFVILAESGWQPSAWFSTSTVRGGNTVVVFDPDFLRFFRYAHLDHAQVAPGDFVEAGQCLGVTGNTGFNANRPGHGHHLHFEINTFGSGVTVATPHEDLRALLTAARETIAAPISTSRQSAPSADPQIALE